LPWGIAVDPDGHVFVTDTDNERVLAFNENGTNLIDEFGEAGEGDNDFISPRGIGFNENGSGDDRLIVADPDQNDNDDRIRRFSGDPEEGGFGNLLTAIGDETPDNNIEPFGVAIDPDDRIWVVNQSAPGVIYRFNRDGSFQADFEPDGQGTLNDPQGIAVFEDDDDNLFVYVADTDNDRVVKFEHINDSDDGLDFVTENEDGGNANLSAPIGLAVDKCGNVWVADSGNDRIAIFDKNLNFIDDFDEDFNLPTGVALGPDGDTLYVVDSINERIVKFDLS
jgi:DNA-binding beta-propeller fold protein YncE